MKHIIISISSFIRIHHRDDDVVNQDGFQFRPTHLIDNLKGYIFSMSKHIEFLGKH